MRRMNGAHVRALQNQNGFTLVELIITIVILGIAVTGIGDLYYTMQIAEVQSQHLDLATRAARSEIEDLRNNGYNALVSQGSINFTNSLPASLPRDRQGTVAISQPVSGLVQVDVTVTYTDYNHPKTVKLTSDIGVIGIGQGQ